MAFNPFDVFRRNQKILFAVLTIVVMFMFVLSFGKGDFFDSIQRWLGSRSKGGGQPVALVNGSKVTDRELDQLRGRRVIANQYMSEASTFARQNLQKQVAERLKDMTAEKRQVVQQFLTLRASGYVNPQQASMLQQFGNNPQLLAMLGISMESLAQQSRQAMAYFSSELARIAAVTGTKETDREAANAARSLVDLDIRGTSARQAQQYFANQPNATRRDALDFYLWLKKADQLGITITDADVNKLVNDEFFNVVTNDDWKAVEVSFKDRSRTAGDTIRQTLGDEFRVRAAQVAVIGRGYTSPLGTGFDAPYDYYQFYRELCSPATYGLITVPVDNYLDKVEGQPTEKELREIFNKYRNFEPSPGESRPGMSEPRKLKLGWLEAKGDEPYYKVAAEDGVKKAGVMAKVGGFLAAPLGGTSTASLLAAAAPLAIPDVILAQKYEEYKSEHRRAVDDSWAIRLFGPPQRPLDTSVVRAPSAASLAAAVGGILASRGNALSATVLFVGEAYAADRVAKLDTLPAVFLAPVGTGVPAAAVATIAAQMRATRPLPLDVVRAQLTERAKDDLGRAICNHDLTKLTEDLNKISNPEDPKAAADALAQKDKIAADAQKTIAEFVKARGLRTGESKEFHDLYSIVTDGGLAPLKERMDAADQFSSQYVSPEQFGSRFFFDSDVVRRLRRTPATGSYKPQPFPQTRLDQMPSKFESVFLVWRTADQPGEPARDFDKTKPKAEAAWRREKARELAKQAAEKLAKECDALGTSSVVIGPKLRDKWAAFAATFASPEARARVRHFEILDVAPLVTHNLDARQQVTQFTLTPTADVPYPSQEMLDTLLKSKDQPLSTAVTFADRPENLFYVAVLSDRRKKGADEFGLSVFGPTAGQLGMAVGDRHQAELHKKARETAIGLLKAEFRYDKEDEKLLKDRGESE